MRGSAGLLSRPECQASTLATRPAHAQISRRSIGMDTFEAGRREAEALLARLVHDFGEKAALRIWAEAAAARAPSRRRGRRPKAPRLPDGTPNLSAIQRRGVAAEVKALEVKDGARGSRTGPGYWGAAAGTIARRVGVAAQTVRKWRRDPLYERAVLAEFVRRMHSEIEQRSVERRAERERTKAESTLTVERDKEGRITITLPEGQACLWEVPSSAPRPGHRTRYRLPPRRD